MTKLYNRISDKEKRKRLRNNMTSAENLLWLYIRKNQVNGYKFRRQFSVCGFVLDFYCPQLKLAIEVDGGIHCKRNAKLYDDERERLLKSLGIKFIRFSNNEVRNKTCEVLGIISKMTKE